MKNNTYNQGNILISLIILFVVVSLAGIGLYFYLQPQIDGLQQENIEVSKNNQDEKKELDYFTIDKQTFYTLLANLKDLDEFELKEDSVSNYKGCEMKSSYIGKMKHGDKYAKSESKYIDSSMEQICWYQFYMDEAYFETFWINNKIYNKQHKDQNIEELAFESKQIKAPDVQEFLQITSLDRDKFNIISIEDIDNSIKVTRTVSNEEESLNEEAILGKIVYFVDKASKKIVSYYFEYISEKDNFSIKGEGILSYLTSVIKLPDRPTTSFLLSSFDEIFNYSIVSYRVNDENYWIIVDSNKSYPMINTSFMKGKNSYCYLSRFECQEKLKELRNYFEEIKGILKDANGTFCSEEETFGHVTRVFEETEIPESRHHSEIYKNLFELKISNKDRNPRESSDYTLRVKFIRSGEKSSNYNVYLRKGEEYCYYGRVDENNFDILLKNFDNITNLLYETGNTY